MLIENFCFFTVGVMQSVVSTNCSRRRIQPLQGFLLLIVNFILYHKLVVSLGCIGAINMYISFSSSSSVPSERVQGRSTANISIQFITLFIPIYFSKQTDLNGPFTVPISTVNKVDFILYSYQQTVMWALLCYRFKGSGCLEITGTHRLVHYVPEGDCL